MYKVLVLVDPQNTFAHPDGELTVHNDDITPGVIANIQALVDDARGRGAPIIGSADSHSYDAWEFIENGGPFPAHGVKGTWGWLFLAGLLTTRTRFIPMCEAGQVTVGEANAGGGNRRYSERAFAKEALSGITLVFEKEVYSLFANPNAEVMIEALVRKLGGPDNVTFMVVGFCLGNYCADAAALGLRERGYHVEVVTDACQALDIGHDGQPQDGMAVSRDLLTKAGVALVTTEQVLK